MAIGTEISILGTSVAPQQDQEMNDTGAAASILASETPAPLASETAASTAPPPCQQTLNAVVDAYVALGDQSYETYIGPSWSLSLPLPKGASTISRHSGGLSLQAERASVVVSGTCADALSVSFGFSDGTTQRYAAVAKSVPSGFEILLSGGSDGSLRVTSEQEGRMVLSYDNVPKSLASPPAHMKVYFAPVNP